MYCTVFLIIWGFIFFRRSKVSFFLREWGFYLKKSVEGPGGYSGLFYYVCSLCILLCFYFPVSTSVCSVAQPHPEQHDQATQPILTAYIWTEAHYLRASYSTLSTHTAWSLRHGHKQTSILVVKLFASSVVAIVHSYLSCERPEHVMMPFFPLLDCFIYSIKMFYQLDWFYALCKW